MNIRQQVLSGTDQLRQQLLQAVDRLDNDFQQRRERRTNVQPQTPHAVNPSTTLSSQQPAFTPVTSQSLSRSPTMPPLPFQNPSPHSHSSVQQPQQPVPSTPISSSGTLESVLQHQSTSLFCTDPRRRTFLWNPKSCLGAKRGQGAYRKGGNKKKKLPTWTHTFICLASTSQTEVPDGDERASLQLSGLGEKRITLNSYSEMQDIYEELLYQFPKLKQGGGFELLRVPEGGGKLLQVIASPESGYTVAYLRAVVHHAKVYIRPMQNNLDPDPEPSKVGCFYVCMCTGYLC